MYDTRIYPRQTMRWSKDLGNWYGGENIDMVDFPNYDNIHNKPWDLLTPEEKEARRSIEGKVDRDGGVQAKKILVDTLFKPQVLKTLRKDTNEPTSVQTVKKPKLIKDPVYDTGGDNGIWTMPTFSTGRSKKFTGVQTTDQEGSRIRTSVEDLPEYIRNDKTFQSLIEDATAAYRNANQKNRENMSGFNKASSKEVR